MYQAGTLSGNPLAVTAGLTTLTELQKEGTYEKLESMAARLADGITQAFATAEIPATLNRVGSMMTGFLNAGPVDVLPQVEQSNTEAYGRYFHAMLERGVYLAPSQFEAGFVSLAHSEEDIDRTVEIVGDALESLG
jgi:glutamate-1-semialdehyde 2,1-aminomutase